MAAGGVLLHELARKYPSHKLRDTCKDTLPGSGTLEQPGYIWNAAVSRVVLVLYREDEALNDVYSSLYLRLSFPSSSVPTHNPGWHSFESL